MHLYVSIYAAVYVTVYTCNYNALLKATTIAQAGRQTDKHTVGQTDIQRKLTQHIHNFLHVKLISFNLNAIWRRFTCCVPRLLRSKCTSICQILCGRYRYLHRDTTSRCCSAAAAHWFSANDAMRHVRASVNYAFIFMIYAFWLTALVVKVFLNFPLQNQIFSRGISVHYFEGVKGLGRITDVRNEQRVVDIVSIQQWYIDIISLLTYVIENTSIWYWYCIDISMGYRSYIDTSMWYRYYIDTIIQYRYDNASTILY